MRNYTQLLTLCLSGWPALTLYKSEARDWLCDVEDHHTESVLPYLSWNCRRQWSFLDETLPLRTSSFLGVYCETTTTKDGLVN